jgi:hypothetical protein
VTFLCKYVTNVLNTITTIGQLLDVLFSMLCHTRGESADMSVYPFITGMWHEWERRGTCIGYW